MGFNWVETLEDHKVCDMLCKHRKSELIMETAPVKYSVGEESCLSVSFYSKERQDQNHEHDSTNDFYLMESDSDQDSLPSSDDHQSMDTPNTFEGNMFLFSVGRKSDASEADQQSRMEAKQNNVKKTKGTCFKSRFQSALRALLVSCAPFCMTSIPTRDEADCDGCVHSRKESSRKLHPE
ncbi:uncharacterized protein LOC108258457 isoform X1 [Ictalurus punctatus]|uniref:Uncharacterized protein LOC108258457 isoform X1 n=1 Tax=Ictalurus punctatus TaxID=7998 RepID=A0A2D0Q2R3_ICTPU|nr:uncharacterized protein LOC108258457 isoform X1 [Ictalurus punctatus]